SAALGEPIREDFPPASTIAAACAMGAMVELLPAGAQGRLDSGESTLILGRRRPVGCGHGTGRWPARELLPSPASGQNSLRASAESSPPRTSRRPCRAAARGVGPCAGPSG